MIDWLAGGSQLPLGISISGNRLQDLFTGSVLLLFSLKFERSETGLSHPVLFFSGGTAIYAGRGSDGMTHDPRKGREQRGGAGGKGGGEPHQRALSDGASQQRLAEAMKQRDQRYHLFNRATSATKRIGFF